MGRKAGAVGVDSNRHPPMLVALFHFALQCRYRPPAVPHKALGHPVDAPDFRVFLCSVSDSIPTQHS